MGSSRRRLVSVFFSFLVRVICLIFSDVIPKGRRNRSYEDCRLWLLRARFALLLWRWTQFLAAMHKLTTLKFETFGPAISTGSRNKKQRRSNRILYASVSFDISFSHYGPAWWARSFSARHFHTPESTVIVCFRISGDHDTPIQLSLEMCGSIC